MHQLSPRLPNFISTSLPPPTDITRASYYLISLGLIMAVPALVTGVREGLVAVNKQGLFESDAKGNSVMREKFKPMIAHVVINDVVLGLATYVWYQRRQAAKVTLAGKLGFGSASTAAAAYDPKTWMVVVEAFCLLGLGAAANAGGVLAYNFGMGMSIGAAPIKDKKIK